MLKTESDEAYTLGPDGERLRISDLPDSNLCRWVPRQKARVVAAVEGGLISREAVLERYRMTAEEYDSWKAALSRSGMRGLRVTKVGRQKRARE